MHAPSLPRKMKARLIGMGLVAFLCSVCATAYEIDCCNLEQVVGNWHILALATDSKWLVKYLDDMEMMVATVKRQEDGSFKLTSSVPTPFGCLKMEAVFSRTEKGTIVRKSAWGEAIVDVAQTDCETYAILVLSRVKGQQASKYATLYARDQQVPAEIEQKFRDQAQELGITEENTRFFEKEVNCLKK